MKTIKLANGIFSVTYQDKEVPYEILNGCLEISGKGNNHYGIVNLETQKITWIGSLQKTKKTLELWIKRACDNS